MRDSIRARIQLLTKRQREIVRLVSLGCTDSEAGAIAGLSPNTVNIYRTKSMQVLGVSKATALTRVAIKYGISPLNDQLSVSERRKVQRKASRVTGR